MEFVLLKKHFDFLVSLNNVSNFISKDTIKNNNITFTVDDVSGFQDIMYFNVVEDGMDKEGAVNSKSRKIYEIYDILLAQKYSLF